MKWRRKAKVKFWEVSKSVKHGLEVYKLLVLLENDEPKTYTFLAVESLNRRLMEYKLPTTSDKELENNQ